MAVFTLISLKLLSLYLNIALGFVAGRYLNVSRESIASLIFYILSPIIVFNAVIKTELSAGILLLPVATFLGSSLLCYLLYSIGKRLWSDSTKNILACSAGTGNTGYFGIPVALLLFDEQTVGVYIVAMLGITLYEVSVGFFITARGEHHLSEVLRKLCKLPAIYAFLIGLVINQLGLHPPAFFDDFVQNIRGAYVVIGMMVIGLGLSTLKSFKLDIPFVALALGAKHIAWPLLMGGFIALDRMMFHLYSDTIYKALFLLSIVPMAANTVVIATVLNAQPTKVAAAVVVSMTLALVLVPVMIAVFL